MAVGVSKPILANTEATPAGVNFSMVFLSKFAA